MSEQLTAGALIKLLSNVPSNTPVIMAFDDSYQYDEGQAYKKPLIRTGHAMHIQGIYWSDPEEDSLDPISKVVIIE